MEKEQELAKAQLNLINKVLGLLKKYEETSEEQRLKGNEMTSKKGKLSDELWEELKQNMRDLRSQKKVYWMEVIKELEDNKNSLENLMKNEKE